MAIKIKQNGAVSKKCQNQFPNQNRRFIAPCSKSKVHPAILGRLMIQGLSYLGVRGKIATDFLGLEKRPESETDNL